VTDAILFTAASAWLLGTGVTWYEMREISTDNPGLRFLIALVAWPFFWAGR
jgi:hypothetical protein